MSDWTERETVACDFNDLRLLQRMQLILARLAENPTASLKAAFRGWAEVMAAYRFCNNKRTSVETVIGPHREATLLRVREHARVLHVQDTSELDYTPKKKLKGTGPLSETSRQGFFAHNQLVITPERLVLGVWQTDIDARDENEHGKAAERKQKPIEEKESHRWLKGYRAACDLAERSGSQVISCADREADIYEIFQEHLQGVESGKIVADFLIRSNQNRLCMREADEEVFGKLHAKAASSPLLGTLAVEVKAKEQYKKVKGGSRKKVSRSGRTATLEIRATTVTLRPPQRKDSKLREVKMQVVIAAEKAPPSGEEPIVWILLTSLPVPDFAAALEIIELYRVRWEIEVFHRVLKTGCKVEQLQLKNDEATKVAVALYMVVAWRVLYVMRLGRECPNLPCDAVFEPDEWQSLWVICHGPESLRTTPTLGEFVLKVAEFGGFLARKADGQPGPQALWQGLTRLRDFTLAWQVYGKKLHSAP
jgi:hypothetical protein